MRRCDIKKRYTDRIELGDNVLDNLLAYMFANDIKVKPLSRRMNVHYNTLYSFVNGKTLPKNGVLFKIQQFINNEPRTEVEPAYPTKKRRLNQLDGRSI